VPQPNGDRYFAWSIYGRDMMTFDAGEIHGQHHISAKMVELAGIVALLHALPQNLTTTLWLKLPRKTMVHTLEDISPTGLRHMLYNDSDLYQGILSWRRQSSEKLRVRFVTAGINEYDNQQLDRAVAEASRTIEASVEQELQQGLLQGVSPSCQAYLERDNIPLL